ncbi:fumarate hydratase [Candidatus Aerophobetes bacterium]|nr:fumarate hydratase [Candidatus Aerophobetes bacterium]
MHKIISKSATNMYEQIYRLVKDVCTGISEDCLTLLKEAKEKEKNKTAKDILETMLVNTKLAKQQQKPVCQSPGFPTCYISFGEQSNLQDIQDSLPKAIQAATKDGYLRPSMVHPLTRKNTGNNSGIGIPNMEYQYVPGQNYLQLIISFKGCGAELGNALKIFTPAQLGKKYTGLKRFILRAVIEAGGKPCPPVAVGIGIGGQMDVAARLSRKAVSIRDWRDTHPDPGISNLESYLLQAVNSLGIGPAGMGGDTTALAVKIELSHTHTAIAPVAVNFHCWVARKGGIKIFPDATIQRIF